jgi:hypothetical protein
MKLSISLVSIALLSYVQTAHATGKLYARNETDAAIEVQVPIAEKSIIGSRASLESQSREASNGNTRYYSSVLTSSHVIQSQPYSKLPVSSFSVGPELSSPPTSSAKSAPHGTPFQTFTSVNRGSTPGSHESIPTISSSKPASHSGKPSFSSSSFSRSVKQSSKSVTAHMLSSSAFTVKSSVKSSPWTTKRTSYPSSYSAMHTSSPKLTSHPSKSTYRPVSAHESRSGHSSANARPSSKLASHSTKSTKIRSRSHPRYSATSLTGHSTWSSKPHPQTIKSSRTPSMYSSHGLHSSSHSYKYFSPPPFPTGHWPYPASYSSIPCTITKTYTRTTTFYPQPTTKCFPMPWPYPDCFTTTITKTVPWYTTVCSTPTTWVESTVTYSHTDYETSTYTVTNCPCERPTTIYYYSTYSTTCTTPIPTTITVITPTPETSCYAETTQEISYSTISTDAAVVSPAVTSATSGVANSASATVSTVTASASQTLATFSSTASHGRHLQNGAFVLLSVLTVMMFL